MRINLTRQQHREITQHERQMAFRVLCGFIDGESEEDRKAWRRFLGLTFKLEPGEISTIDVRCKRVGPFQRRHMLLESLVFAAQEAFHDFEKGFRDWLKLGAGFVDWHARSGVLTPVPRSTSYEEVEEVEFRAFHDKAVQFLKTERACRQLWPHLSARGGREMIDGLLKRMDE